LRRQKNIRTVSKAERGFTNAFEATLNSIVP